MNQYHDPLPKIVYRQFTVDRNNINTYQAMLPVISLVRMSHLPYSAFTDCQLYKH